jgi:hypothetical protein
MNNKNKFVYDETASGPSVSIGLTTKQFYDCIKLNLNPCVLSGDNGALSPYAEACFNENKFHDLIDCVKNPRLISATIECNGVKMSKKAQLCAIIECLEKAMQHFELEHDL